MRGRHARIDKVLLGLKVRDANLQGQVQAGMQDEPCCCKLEGGRGDEQVNLGRQLGWGPTGLLPL